MPIHKYLDLKNSEKYLLFYLFIYCFNECLIHIIYLFIWFYFLA